MYSAFRPYRFFAFYVVSLSLIICCKKENHVSTNKNIHLAFSTDTILFDTIFTTLGSVTKRLKVYNHENKAVVISRIKLEAQSSFFQLNINGQAQNSSTDVQLKANDSLYIFVKVLINPNSSTLPFIVSDSISFLTNGNRQVIHLEAYGQNAHFLKDATITQNTNWDNIIPYVIYNTLLVDENATLNIQKGTQIYLHKDASIAVAGSLNANGELTNKIEFKNDRKESLYLDEPGQWYGIKFLKSSKSNSMNYCIIKNAVFGLQVTSLSDNNRPKLLLTNSIIKNMSSSALALDNTKVVALNNLVYNCGQYLVYVTSGGNYIFKQNTFAAYNFNFSVSNPAVYFSPNGSPLSNSAITQPLQVILMNNIIWGSYDSGLFIDQKNLDPSSITISSNLLKYKSDLIISNTNFQNKDPLFIDARKENFRLNSSSPAVLRGTDLSTDNYFNSFLSKTLDGKTRTFPSDLGCF